MTHQVHHSVEKILNVNNSWYKVCHFLHTFSIRKATHLFLVFMYILLGFQMAMTVRPLKDKKMNIVDTMHNVYLAKYLIKNH